MMFSISELIRPELLKFKPYTSARHLVSSGEIMLDANENPYDGENLNRYPDPNQIALRESLSNYADAPLDNIFVGSGSDEIIDLLIRLFCKPEIDEVLIIEPTYGMYRVCAELNGINVSSCLLNDNFDIELLTLRSAVSENTKIIFCCSPNNPTGNRLSVAELLEYTKSDGIITIVDEAYLEFSKSTSVSRLLNEYPNLVVLRTFSKAWGLAGIRLGYSIAAAEIVSYLMNIKLPYNINVLSSNSALKALSNKANMEKKLSEIITERERLIGEFNNLSIFEDVYPSVASFILLRSRFSSKIKLTLADNGIIVRDRSAEPLLENCLRITVGTPEQNEKLLNVLKGIII